jgi:hypothetical protein
MFMLVGPRIEVKAVEGYPRLPIGKQGVVVELDEELVNDSFPGFGDVDYRDSADPELRTQN